MPLPDPEILCAAIDVVDVGLALVGPDREIRFCNTAYGDFVGRSAEELLGTSVLGPGAPCHAVRECGDEWDATDIFSASGTSPTGEPVDIVARPVQPGSDVRVLVVRRGLVRAGRGLSRDVVEDVRRFAAGLTGHETDVAALGNGPLSILMLGLAGPAELVRRKGTEGVEEVLRQVARALVLQKRKSDIIGRYGEGQFLVLAPETPRHGAIMLAERIQRSVDRLEIVLDGEPLDVELLAYAAEYRPHLDGSVAEAVEKASEALRGRAEEIVDRGRPGDGSRSGERPSRRGFH